MLPRLLIIGTGPTNLFLLKELARRPEPKRETILLASVPQELSPGTLPGLLAGRYRPSEVGVNLERLADSARARLVVGEVRQIEPATRTVRLENGETLLYNAASLSTGPYPSSSRVPGAGRHGRFVHTLDQAMEIVPALERIVQDVPEGLARVVVHGGTSDALQVAMALRSVLDRIAAGKGVVTLIASGHTVWKEKGLSGRLAEAALRRQDITAIMGAQIAEVTSTHLKLSNGAGVGYDLLIWAGGDQAPEYLARSEFQIDRERNVVVDDYLHAADAPGLFVGGEVTIKQDDQPLRVEVDPHKGARVIAENLLSVLHGRAPGKTYRPRQRVQLAETGEERALLTYGNLGVEGRWLMALKQRADRRLMHLLGGHPQASQ